MKRILLFASALALAACSNGGGSSNNAPAGNIPGKLGNHPVANKAALTSNEKMTIKSFSAKMEKMPDASLFLPAQNESDSERTDRAEKKNKLSQDARFNYERIQNNCQFQFPQTSGSQQSSTVTSSIGGTSCPIAFNQTIKNEMIEQSDKKKATFKSTTSGNLQILDPSMQNQVGFSKSTITFNMTGALMATEQSYSSYMSGSGGVTLQALNGQNASMGMTYEMLVNDQSMSSYMEMSFTLDSINATVQAYIDSNQGSQTARFYLNGQPTTEAELKQIFGDNFSLQANQN